MSIGWVIFIIVLVLGIIVSNLLLLKKTAKTKIPDKVLDAIREKKEKALREELATKQRNEKPD